MNIVWVIVVAIMVYLFVHSSSDFRLQMPGTRSFIYIRPVLMGGHMRTSEETIFLLITVLDIFYFLCYSLPDNKKEITWMKNIVLKIS